MDRLSLTIVNGSPLLSRLPVHRVDTKRGQTDIAFDTPHGVGLARYTEATERYSLPHDGKALEAALLNNVAWSLRERVEASIYTRSTNRKPFVFAGIPPEYVNTPDITILASQRDYDALMESMRNRDTLPMLMSHDRYRWWQMVAQDTVDRSFILRSLTSRLYNPQTVIRHEDNDVIAVTFSAYIYADLRPCKFPEVGRESD